MSNIIKEKDINKLRIEEQLKFYKDELGFRHCELDGCGNEVHNGWVIYDGSLYCDSCFNWLIQEEFENALEQIAEYEENIKILKERYSIK